MTEQEWADEPTVPEKKKGLPGWLWFCGGGCLIAVILAVIGGFFLYNLAQDMADPDKQWPKFAEHVEFDERPEEWTIIGMPIPTIDAFVLTDSAGNIVTLLVYSESSGEEVDQLFGGEFTGGGVPGLSAIENPVQGEVVVQGRTLRMVNFTQSHMMDEMDGLQGAFLDITPEGSPRPQLFQIITQTKETPVSEELLEELLAPFHIGPIR